MFGEDIQRGLERANAMGKSNKEGTVLVGHDPGSVR